MRIAAVILSTLILVSCTTRVEYSPAAAEDPSDINTAAAADLERLPGIGARTAAAVIGHRSEYGAFRRREHILLVPGVSEARYRAAFPSAAR